MNYNVKTIGYKDSLQVRVYAKPVITQDNIKIKKTIPVSYSPTAPKERTKEQEQHSIKSSVNRTVNQIYAISRSNHWEYFITLTIDPKKLNNADFELILDKLSIWINNLKKRYAPDLRYIIVPELHKNKQRWHFHGLFSDVGNLPFEFSGKVCVGKYIYDYARKPYATKIYNLPLWKYGFSTATVIRDSAKASSYITKYITKDLTNVMKNRHRYVASQNTERPVEQVYSIDYESLENIINKNLQYVDYISNVKVKEAGQIITYMEFNKGV